MPKTEAVTVRLTQPLAKFIAEKAQREDRSLAGQVRHMLADAARREQIEAPPQAA